MNKDAVTYLKSLVDCTTLLKQYGVTNVSEHGNTIRCSCPIHKGNNPTAFVMNTESKLWFCHTKCHVGGDIYDLVMQIEKIDFGASVLRIAEMLNADISDMTINLRTDKALQNTRKWIDTMRGIVESNTEVTPKLFDISMLGRLCAIKSYRQFDRETLEHFNIKFCIDNQRIVIPIYVNKQLIGVTMRRTKTHPAKWIHQPAGLLTRNILFNYDNITPCELVIVCEGVFDVMNYWVNGFTNVVATFGCHMTHAQMYMLLKAHHEIILSYDNDKAGIIGMRIALSMLKDKASVRIARLPDNSDPGMLNKEQLSNAINNAYKTHEWRK